MKRRDVTFAVSSRDCADTSGGQERQKAADEAAVTSASGAEMSMRVHTTEKEVARHMNMRHSSVCFQPENRRLALRRGRDITLEWRRTSTVSCTQPSGVGVGFSQLVAPLLSSRQ